MTDPQRKAWKRATLALERALVHMEAIDTTPQRGELWEGGRDRLRGALTLAGQARTALNEARALHAESCRTEHPVELRMH